MKLSPAALIAGLALALSATAVTAEEAMPPGQQPPADQRETKAEPAAEPKRCVTQDTGFFEEGKQPVFRIVLTNTCEFRLRCTVNAYVVGSQGPKQGNATLTLAPASKGAAAKQTYTMTLKQSGGMANTSHRCTPI